MPKYLAPVDLTQNELRNAVIQNLASPPSSPKVGQEYYDTGQLMVLTWNGTSWTNLATNSNQLGGQLPAYYLARANQTGTQTSSTISDLATVVKAYTLDSFATPVANVSFGGYNITNLADPTSAQQGATKNYVDNQIQLSAAGIASKAPVIAVSTANISSLSGLPTVDGVTLTAGQRLLLVGQTTASQNGVWLVASGSWTRPTDDGATAELTTNALWMVSQGTAYAKTQWMLSTTGTITPGTTALTINQYSAAAAYTASYGVTLVGVNFQIQLATGTGVAGPGLLTGAASGLTIDKTVVTQKVVGALGDGSSTSITITHNLGTQDVGVFLRDSSGNRVETDWQAATANTVVFTFGVAPASNAYRYTIVG